MARFLLVLVGCGLIGAGFYAASFGLGLVLVIVGTLCIIAAAM